MTTVDLEKQSLHELGEYLSLSDKYKDCDRTEVLRVYRYKLAEVESDRIAKQQSKLDAFHRLLRENFEKGYYKDTVVTLWNYNRDQIRVVLTGEAIAYITASGLYQPIYYYYLEKDSEKKIAVGTLDIAVAKVEPVRSAKMTFEEVVNSAKLPKYFLE